MNARSNNSLIKTLQQWFRQTGTILTPRSGRCACCGKSASSEAGSLPLCRGCFEHVPWIREVKCEICGRYEECHDCRRRSETSFICNRSAVRYDERMKELLARYKYRGDERLLQLFSGMTSYAYRLLLRDSELGSHPPNCITYIPLSAERAEERGFNQAEQLANKLGAAYRIPVVPLLARTRHTNKQSFKTRAERLQDLQGAFAMNPNAAANIQRIRSSIPIKIIIVDDVYTTGSTLNHCAAILKSSLNARIYGLTWAR